MNKNIIFDYDGTLHESIKIYAPAFRKAYQYLVENKFVEDRFYSDEEISKWLGYSSKDMWNSFMPNIHPEIKAHCSNIIGSSMLTYIKEGKANLYEGALETLQYLKENGYVLIFLSNCKIEYMRAHIEAFNLDRYMDSFYCTEQYDFIPKYEIFEHIKLEHEGEFIVVGDRFQDIEIAEKHNLNSIACNYGYGDKKELENATWTIDDIREIKKILDLGRA